jgi:hypothetical protein
LPQTSRDYQAKYDAKQRAKLQEIGPLPDPADPAARSAAAESLQAFCERYRPEAFPLEWSPDHLLAINRMQTTIRSGGLYALAMPRGSGKTTIATTAALWALLYGYRRWVCLVGGTEKKSQKALAAIKMELRFNRRLLADFPEACYPIVQLEGQARRAISQMVDGENTNIGWHVDALTLPTIAGSLSSGGKISVCGITGDIRGQFDVLSSGEVIRPDYVIPDDPQTRESAKSAQQTEDRLATLMGDVLGLAGPSVKISGVMPCTVIYRGDLADQVLNRDEHPEWHGQKTQMLSSMPTRMDLWEQYHETRSNELRNEGDGSLATEFYRQNQDEMDNGCEASWTARFNSDEISAIQNAMNLFFRDPVAFWAEYQNEPTETQDDTTLTAEQIMERQHNQYRTISPSAASIITAFVDVQQNMLFYCVVAWTDKFRGFVIDYGTFPDQRARSFFKSTARKTLARAWPKLSLEAAIRKALEELTGKLCETRWTRDDGADLSISRLMIDAQWGRMRDVVYTFCRESQHRAIVLPSHGKFIGASTEPLNFRATANRKSGRLIGEHWRIEKAKDSPSRYIIYDTNHWKSFVHERLATDPAESSSITLYRDEPRNHKLFASHLKAEYPVRVEGRGRVVDEWKAKPDRSDNDWLDCLVGNAVAASERGCRLQEVRQQMQARPQRNRQRVSYL